MIISDKHKYIFIQIPHTASTAIGDELCINYDGKRILNKHSLYFEFEKLANAEEKNYFVFACIRNPLDDVVSRYFKYKSNHMETFTTPRYWQKNGGNGWVTNKQLSQYQWIAEQDATFENFFLKYYQIPYDSWISIEAQKYDYVMRFESIEQDFNEVLNSLKLTQKRTLPFRNKTSLKDQDVFSYFTPEIQKQALFVFGPFLKKWGYNFPEDWNDQSISVLSQIEFELLSVVRKFHRKYLRKDRGGKLPLIFNLNRSRGTVWSNQEIKP
jgi:hypothetical protein